VRRVTAWLRSELAAAASRAERYGMAHLVRVDFRRIGRAGEVCRRWKTSPLARGGLHPGRAARGVPRPLRPDARARGQARRADAPAA